MLAAMIAGSTLGTATDPIIVGVALLCGLLPLGYKWFFAVCVVAGVAVSVFIVAAFVQPWRAELFGSAGADVPFYVYAVKVLTVFIIAHLVALLRLVFVTIAQQRQPS